MVVKIAEGSLETRFGHYKEYLYYDGQRETIARQDGKTEARFTHTGLVPAFECYNNCSNAWSVLVGGNLRKLIATGEDQPWPW